MTILKKDLKRLYYLVNLIIKIIYLVKKKVKYIDYIVE